MIDEIAIVSVAGVLLWSWASPDLDARPSIQLAINQLFHDVLLRDGKAREAHYDAGSSRIKWNRCKERGVVVVATYNRDLARSHDFSYVDKLLASTSQVIRDYVSEAMGALTETLAFDRQWAAVQRKAAARTTGAVGPAPAVEMPAGRPTPAAAADEEAVDDVDEMLGEIVTSPPSAGDAIAPSMSRLERMAAIKARRSARGGSGKTGPSRFAGIKTSGSQRSRPDSSSAVSPTAQSPMSLGPRINKKATAGGLRKLSSREQQSLSYNPLESADAARTETETVEFGKGELDIVVDWQDGDAGADTAEAGGAPGTSSSWFAGTAFGRALGVFSGGHILTDADLVAVGTELEDQLKAKNVTAGIAADLVSSVKASLVGTKAGAFDSMLQVIRGALRTRITRILTPERRVDPISDARANRDRFRAAAASGASATSAEAFRPYIIVFTGVNGVGKSTSLAKLVYHLKSSGLRPMVAACDTFRSGAVEQLRRHTDLLGVALFEKGYEKDPARVATAAVAAATEGGYDVVCIDTAGRMQGKKDLMQELAQLVSINDPDLVLFVGEALAGHDGLDQLTQFDKSLRAYAAPGTSPHGIDGIFLTKCDTIDDKIGAAVSMVHGTEIPIAFMGVGQKYTDMKRLNVDVVVRALMA